MGGGGKDPTPHPAGPSSPVPRPARPPQLTNRKAHCGGVPRPSPRGRGGLESFRALLLLSPLQPQWGCCRQLELGHPQAVTSTKQGIR